jgi:hypothetical protein
MMSVIPALRNVSADSILTGMAASAGPMSSGPAADLVIESLDEFDAGFVPTSLSGADYVIGAALSTAYN